MSLAENINNLAIAIAEEFNAHPKNFVNETPATAPLDTQFWRRISDNTLYQYYAITGKFEPIAAQLTSTYTIDGGNF